MPVELLINRDVPSFSPDDETTNPLLAFDTAIKGAIGTKMLGTLLRKGKLFILVSDDCSAEERNAAIVAALNHDFTNRTTEQTARAARKQDIQDARQQFGALLDEINADIDILNANPPLAQLTNAVKRMAQRQRQVIKALRAVVIDEIRG